jgi:hypothetical protein
VVNSVGQFLRILQNLSDATAGAVVVKGQFRAEKASNRCSLFLHFLLRYCVERAGNTSVRV